MNIAIIDDKESIRSQLRELLETNAQKHHQHITLYEFEDAQDFMDIFEDQFNLVYMDIEMQQLNGMEAAKSIRSYPSSVPLVFVTNYVQYAIEGYGVDALDFIIKPLNALSFEKHFEKVISKFQNTSDTSSITIRFKSEVVRILISDLLFVESKGHYVYYQTKTSRYTAIDTLKSIEENLSNYGFFRCNNHYLVNLQNVQSVRNDMVIMEKHELKISRPRKKEFMNILTKYLGGLS